MAAVDLASFRPDEFGPVAFAVATIGGAAVAGALNVLRLVRLHRRGVTFRAGPWQQRTGPTGPQDGGRGDGGGHTPGASSRPRIDQC